MTLGEHITIRLSKDQADAARRLADADGMDLSAWIRREVDREISKREGRCSHCGQEIKVKYTVVTLEDLIEED